MNAKEIVQNRMHNANVEEHTTLSGVKNWYVVNGDEYVPFAKGETEERAWSVAKEILLDREQAEG